MMKTIKTYLHDYKDIIRILYCGLIALIYYRFCKSIDKKYDSILKDIDEEES